MGQKVVCHQEMVYNGVKRYKDEVFELQNARNDYKLVSLGQLRIFDPEAGFAVITDDSGREFLSESARQKYRRESPGDTEIRVRRGPGRPKGSKNSKPRQTVRETAPEPATVRI